MILRGIRFGGRHLCILEFNRGVGLGAVCSGGMWCCRLVIVIRWATRYATVDFGGLRMEILFLDVVSTVFHQ